MLSDRMGPLNSDRFLRQPVLIEGSRVKLHWDSYTRTEWPQHVELSVLNILAHIEFGTSFILTFCLLLQVIVKISHVPVKWVFF